MTEPLTLILGSSSRARAAVMDQVGLRYQKAVPDIDESVLDGESVSQYVRRLSLEKAQAVVARLPAGQDFIVIGCDQVAADDFGMIYSKPGTLENATEMLKQMSSKRIRYYCGLTVVSTKTQDSYTDISITEMQYRDLDDQLIAQYLAQDPSAIVQCAAAFKIEGAGSLLLESYSCNDPTSCQGLPLILLDKMLRLHGCKLADFLPEKVVSEA